MQWNKTQTSHSGTPGITYTYPSTGTFLEVDKEPSGKKDKSLGGGGGGRVVYVKYRLWFSSVIWVQDQNEDPGAKNQVKLGSWVLDKD